MSDPRRQAMLHLLDRAGIEARGGCSVKFSGADPQVESRLRYGAATAAALAAHGVGVAELHCLRGGPAQEVGVDLGRAVHVGLRTAAHLRQNGRAFRVGSWTRSENFFRSADGRVLYLLRNNGRGTITEDLVGFLRASNDTAGIAEAVRQWDAFELEEELARRKLPGVVVRTPEEWRKHPQGRWLEARPGLSVERIGGSPAEPLGPAARPLDGLRILDASHVIAGPALGRLLAEQGGDVLQIVKPSEQETIPVHIDSNLGKRSTFLNLDEPADQQTMRALVRGADIFIQSWRPGALRRRGLGPEEVAALRPGIICVSISCYGDEGPWAGRGGYEPIGQAASGLCAVEGTPDEPRNAPTGTMNDYLAAYLAGLGVMGALLRRCREGGSYHVTTSLAQASMWVLAQGFLTERPRPEDVPAYTLAPGDLTERACAFGALTHAAPVIRYSASPGWWERDPQPPGASRAEWLPRAASTIAARGVA